MNKSQKEIEYQRYFQLLDMFIKEGSIFFMHPIVLSFGKKDKKHFAVSKSNLKYGHTFAKFNPCTSQKQNTVRKDIFTFIFSEGSTIKDFNDKATYVLLALTKKVKLTGIVKPELCQYKGKMIDKTLEEYRRAKRDFIESVYKRGKES